MLCILMQIKKIEPLILLIFISSSTLNLALFGRGPRFGVRGKMISSIENPHALQTRQHQGLYRCRDSVDERMQPCWTRLWSSTAFEI